MREPAAVAEILDAAIRYRRLAKLRSPRNVGAGQ